MSYLFRLLVLVLILLSFPSCVNATTKTIYPLDDVYINNSLSRNANNYSAYSTLRLSGNDANRYSMLFLFPIDEIPDGKVITSAKFKLYFRQTLDNSPLASGVIEIFPITSAWNENTVTWNNRPSKDVERYDNGRLFQVNNYVGYQEWEITSLVQQWINHPEENFGFYVESPTAEWSCGFDSGQGQYSPTLIVEYGLSIPTFIKPVIKFIPGLIAASPTPEPVAQPTPTPQVVASPTITPLPLPSPSPAPTQTPRAAPRAIDEPNPSPTVLVSQPATERVESPAPLLVPGILGSISLLSIIGSLFIIKLLRNRKIYARNRTEPRNKTRSNR